MDFAGRHIVRAGERPRLSKVDTRATGGLGRTAAERLTRSNAARLDELQYLMYAESRRMLLVVFQALDAGGKDGCIRRVLTGVNPQGCRVTSFKVPSAKELSHDFLWRIHAAAPARGMIGVFNRSHYEDVLVARVRGLVAKQVWRRRYAHINAFEKMLAENGVTILKFFLHVSKDEQEKRLMERLRDPRKHWKADPGDFEERGYWDDYMAAYEDALERCSTKEAPWFVIPSDRKWYRDAAVSSIMVEALGALDMKLPPPAAGLPMEEAVQSGRKKTT